MHRLYIFEYGHRFYLKCCHWTVDFPPLLATAMDVLTLLSAVRCIKTKSKTEIIRTLQSFDEQMLRYVLIATLSKLKPSIEAQINSDSNGYTVWLLYSFKMYHL